MSHDSLMTCHVTTDCTHLALPCGSWSNSRIWLTWSMRPCTVLSRIHATNKLSTSSASMLSSCKCVCVCFQGDIILHFPYCCLSLFSLQPHLLLLRTRKGREKDHTWVVQHCNSLVGFTFSLIPRSSITANAVEGLVKRKMTSDLEAWHFWPLPRNATIHNN